MKIYLYERFLDGKPPKLYLSKEGVTSVALSRLNPGGKPDMAYSSSKLGYFESPFDSFHASTILFNALLQSVAFLALEQSGQIHLFLKIDDEDPLATLNTIWPRLTDVQKDEWLQFIARTDARFVVDFRQRMP